MMKALLLKRAELQFLRIVGFFLTILQNRMSKINSIEFIYNYTGNIQSLYLTRGHKYTRSEKKYT